MTKALLKKQLLETFAWVYKDKKTGTFRSAKGLILYALLYLMVFVSVGSMFYLTADALCQPLVMAGMGWMYWCLMGLLGVFLGVFGSVFTTYSSLYGAKDNDLLLAMPIPVSRILLVRLLGVYAIGLMYQLLVMIPAILVWFVNAPFSPVGAVCVLLSPLVLSVLVLVLSAVLGWVVALVVGRLKHKNLITVIVSLAFIAAYYYVYSKASAMLQTLLQNIAAVGEKIRSVLYPLYHMGLAAEGNPLSMLIFTAIIAGLFLVVYLVLSRSFLRLATTNRGSAKTVYKARRQKTRTLEGALLQKEFRRYLGSSIYMLNCSLGVLLMPIAAVLLIYNAGSMQTMLAIPMLRQILPLLSVGAVCMILSMNDLTAPSVSLEGKNLWILQAFPVPARKALEAKLKLHLLLTVIPAIPLVAAVEWVIKPDLLNGVLMPVAILLFIVLMAALGLCVNLKMPNLNWTSETVPVKQSMSVTVALFGGWVIVMAFAGLYVLLNSILSPGVYLALVCGLLLVFSGILLRWLFTRGAEIFDSL